jgi:sRNA-binding carbon storage regulator CsrA
MLVLTRRVNESVKIGDHLLVTLLSIRGDRVNVRFSSTFGGTGRSETSERWMRRGDEFEIDAGVKVSIFDVRSDRVRFGFLAPIDMPIKRPEADDGEAGAVV